MLDEFFKGFFGFLSSFTGMIMTFMFFIVIFMIIGVIIVSMNSHEDEHGNIIIVNAPAEKKEEDKEND